MLIFILYLLNIIGGFNFKESIKRNDFYYNQQKDYLRCYNNLDSLINIMPNDTFVKYRNRIYERKIALTIKLKRRLEFYNLCQQAIDINELNIAAFINSEMLLDFQKNEFESQEWLNLKSIFIQKYQWNTAAIDSNTIFSLLNACINDYYYQSLINNKGNRNYNLEYDSVRIINISILDTAINKYHLLTKDKVGIMAQNLFSIIQHSSTGFNDYHKKYIEEMFAAKKMHPYLYAMYIDRYLLHNGKMQLYGTQYYYDTITNKYTLSPMFEPENLNKRLINIGLEGLVKY